MARYFIVVSIDGTIKVMSLNYMLKMIGRVPKFNKNLELRKVYNYVSDSRKECEDIITNKLLKRYDYVALSRKVKLTDICKDYLKSEDKFQWFIERYFGPNTILGLRETALANKSEQLYCILDNIWFDLPDHIFNIMNNPDGWNEFLSIVDNDFYKKHIWSLPKKKGKKSKTKIKS